MLSLPLLAWPHLLARSLLSSFSSPSPSPPPTRRRHCVRFGLRLRPSLASAHDPTSSPLCLLSSTLFCHHPRCYGRRRWKPFASPSSPCLLCLDPSSRYLRRALPFAGALVPEHRRRRRGCQPRYCVNCHVASASRLVNFIVVVSSPSVLCGCTHGTIPSQPWIGPVNVVHSGPIHYRVDPVCQHCSVDPVRRAP